MKLSTVASLAGIASIANALSQISVKGSKFFDGNGNQYFIKGVYHKLIAIQVTQPMLTRMQVLPTSSHPTILLPTQHNAHSMRTL